MNSPNTKSPKEVFKAIYSDWKSHGITLDKAADILGYSSRQTIYNMRSSNHYLRREQAFRFASQFGYSIKFLTEGIGELRESINPTHYRKFKAIRLEALLQIATGIISHSGNPDALKAWGAINQQKLDDYLASMRDLITKEAGVVLPGQDLEFTARIACKKNASELIEETGYIDSDMVTDQKSF